jgi:hypothetical protein
LAIAACPRSRYEHLVHRTTPSIAVFWTKPAGTHKRDIGLNIPPLAKEKPRSEATRLRGLFEHPGSLRERLALRLVGTKGRRSRLRCRRLKCHIECDNCLLDPRLIDPSFSAMPRAAIPRGIEVCPVQTG